MPESQHEWRTCSCEKCEWMRDDHQLEMEMDAHNEPEGSDDE